MSWRRPKPSDSRRSRWRVPLSATPSSSWRKPRSPDMRVGGVILASTLLVGGAAAQGGFVKPTCELHAGHFLVNSGLLYIQSAPGRRFDQDRQKDLRDANRTLTQAVQPGGQDQNHEPCYPRLSS